MIYRDEFVPLIGGFPLFGGHFRHFCDFPRSVIKVWGDGGGGGVGVASCNTLFTSL